MLIINPGTYKSIIRPLLFNLSPETAQGAAEFALRQDYLWKALSPLLKVDSPRLETTIAGLRLKNPVGLAAGYDKDCKVIPSLAAMGFGYVTCGTVTAMPQPGNPRPRVLRYVEDEALVNALGFPSKGLASAAEALGRVQEVRATTPIVVSVSGVTDEDILKCHRRLEPLADAVEINISSPNTAGLRVFQESDALGKLLDQVNDERQRPLFIKLPPYPSSKDQPSAGDEEREKVLGLVEVCVNHGVSAVTVSNTWPVRDSRLAVGSGGLSGRVVFPDTLRMVADLKAVVGDAMAINACGGIFSGKDAFEVLQAGATTVQVLTGLIYRGPGIARSINERLLAAMDEGRVVSLGLGRGATPGARSRG